MFLEERAGVGFFFCVWYGRCIRRFSSSWDIVFLVVFRVYCEICFISFGMFLFFFCADGLFFIRFSELCKGGVFVFYLEFVMIRVFVE